MTWMMYISMNRHFSRGPNCEDVNTKRSGSCWYTSSDHSAVSRNMANHRFPEKQI